MSASDAAIILGSSPYKTPWRLWAEKTGYAVPEDLSKNPEVIRGITFEGEAITAYENLHDEMLLPVCVESTSNPLLRASLDGLDSQNRPVEIKCPSEKIWDEVMYLGTGSVAFQLYFIQVQWQLMVTEASEGFLAFYNVWTKELKVFAIKANPKLHEEMTAKAMSFWNLVKTRKAPEKDPHRDIFIPEDAQAEMWISLAEEFRTYDAEIDLLQQRLQELKEKQQPLTDQMVGIMGEHYLADYCGVTITRFTANRIDYKRIVEEQLSLTDEDLDLYRDRSERRRVTAKDSLVPRNIVDDDVVESLSETNGTFESAWC